MNQEWRDATKQTEQERLELSVKRLTQELIDVKEAYEKQILELENKILTLQEQKINLTERFLNHTQERQREDREWIENLKRKIAELPK